VLRFRPRATRTPASRPVPGASVSCVLMTGMARPRRAPAAVDALARQLDPLPDGDGQLPPASALL
jgi:hypothetical protein